MPSLADTIRRLQSGPLGDGTAADAPARRLRRLTEFGSNPGALDGWFQVPEGEDAVALVVVLHGCTQSAAGYDHGSGWSTLGDANGFAVLFPEQRRTNNPNLCFNWFLDEDTQRDSGEALSIRQMIGAVAARYPIDQRRVFVTGLSAGGAMANVMLATYPELFAGGAIIAGLPYGAAASVPQALERMRGVGHVGEAAYAALVARASSHRGPWPQIAVWHGDADRTVDVINAEAIIGQWRSLHGLDRAASLTDLVDGQRHRVWADRDGNGLVEDYRIAGMGHGTPLKTSGSDNCGVAGPHMLDVGISSTWHQAQRWGLLRTSPRPTVIAAPERKAPAAPSPNRQPAASSVTETIERALRSAGLMP